MKEIRDERVKRSSQAGAESEVTNSANGSAVITADNSPETGDPSVSLPTQIFTNDYENTLPSHYKLIRMIARGGMAEVFLAFDDRLNRNVAIKFLNSEFRRDADRMHRFYREARAASALNHPNILVVHDIGENEGIQYIVSEYVDGETLGARIARGRISLSEAVDIAVQIASALAAAHKAGVVHRDVKPDNVIIRRDGVVKVVDFGLAKDNSDQVSAYASDPNAKTMATVSTSPGLILGTPQYMSPEQARGQFLDARTDIFSLGIIIYEMVTGTRPFGGGTIADVIAAILNREPPDVDDYLKNPPLRLTQILRESLAKDRDERYGSMEPLLADLKELKSELGSVEYQPRTTTETFVSPTLQNTIRTVAARIVRWDVIVVTAVVAVFALLGWWYWKTTPIAAPATAGSMRTIPITSWNSSPGDLVSSASFSPDARMVAYSATKANATEIWVKPATGGDPVQVTRNGYYNLYPVWSPNQDEIAFLSNRNGERGIWRASYTGGEQKRVASVGPTARPMCWSKSGTIYFQEGSELFSVKDDGSDRKQITDFKSKNITPWYIEVSPDESTVAYTIRNGDTWKIVLKNVGDEKSTELATSKLQIQDMTWTSDGRSIVYSASVDGAYQVFRVDTGGGEPIQLSNSTSDMYVQDISADASKILFASVSETSDIWSVDLQSLKQTPVANEVASEYWPDVSPDGRSVAYQFVQQVDRVFGSSIMVVPRAGGAPSMSISPQGFSPVWSPDGNWIAFFERTDDGIGIFREGPDGAAKIKLADGTISPPGYTVTPHMKIGVNHIAWSPKSDFLAYAATTGGFSNIWIVGVDGSGNRALTDNRDASEKLCCPAWTSDGKYLVYSSSSGPQAPRKISRLWLYSLAGANQSAVFESASTFRFIGFAENGENALLVQSPADAISAATPQNINLISLSLADHTAKQINTLDSAYIHNVHLSRDGRTIAFVSKRDDQTALWTVPVNGGTPKRILTENDPKILISSLAWVPDGSSIIFGKETRTNLLSMLAK